MPLAPDKERARCKRADQGRRQCDRQRGIKQGNDHREPQVHHRRGGYDAGRQLPSHARGLPHAPGKHDGRRRRRVESAKNRRQQARCARACVLLHEVAKVGQAANRHHGQPNNDRG